jgi:hypothetical protein
MKRFLRILLNLATVVSLALCVATVTVWVASRKSNHWITRAYGRQCVQIESSHSTLRITTAGKWPDDERARRAADILRSTGAARLYPGADHAAAEFVATRDVCIVIAAHAQQQFGEEDPIAKEKQDAVAAWNARLAALASNLVSKVPPEIERVAAVTIERGSCRLPAHDVAGRVSFEPSVPLQTIAIPYWLILVALSVPLAIVTCSSACRRAIAGCRAHAGICPRCGYDLRATPDRCPECGRITA